MTRAEIIATIPRDIPDEVVAREVGTAISYVRQIRRHGVEGMRESSREHSARHRERNLPRVRKMQRDWARRKKLRTTGEPVNVDGAWEDYLRQQDKAFMSHMMKFEDRTYKDIRK